MTYYKTLDGLDAVNGGSYTYPGVGRWTAHLDPDRLEPCGYGYHLAEDEQVLDWLGPTIYVAEPCGEHPPVNDGDKWVTCRVRLVRRTAWDERIARLFAADCAERLLGIYEAHCPGDYVPREATRVARAYAEGEATLDDLTAAWAAAGDAATAAWAAAGDAAMAAGDVAMAAMAAAGATPREAWAAAIWAAWASGAREDIWDAEAWDAWHAERAWQYQRLTHYLTGSDR